MALTPEEKEVRRVAREVRKAAEELAKHEEFLVARESFRNDSYALALELLARAGRHLLVHTKVTSGTHPRKDQPDDKYLLVQFWTGDESLEIDLYVWEELAQTQFELDCRKWEFESAVQQFEEYEEKLNEERERAQKRREVLERLSPEERELLGV